MSVKLLFILLAIKLNSSDLLTVDEFKDDWYRNIKDAESWSYPNRSDEFLNAYNANQCKEYGTFDFVIVGGGTAGSILASRLSEVSMLNILLIEAGGNETEFSLVPANAAYVRASEMNWGFLTEPQKQICKAMKNRQCPYASGKVLGGGSAINGLGYSRGHRSDFDSWMQLSSDSGWGYDEMLLYFRKAENASGFKMDAGYHGDDGPLSITTYTPPPPLSETILQGFEENGLKRIDYNGKQQIGVSLYQNTIKNGQRASTNQAYLQPNLDRNNLKILTHSLATKILFKSKFIASGIQFLQNDTCYNVHVKYEVILSAGTVNTPKLLMLSGIGPSEELTKHNIYARVNLPVGQNFQDHTGLNSLKIKVNVTTFDSKSFDEDVQDYLNHNGILTYGDGHEIVLMRLAKNFPKDRPDSELVCTLGLKYSNTNVSMITNNYRDDMRSVLEETDSDANYFYCNAVLLNTISKGEVTLRSTDPLDFPKINPNYYSNKSEKTKLISIINKLIEMLEAPSFKSINATLMRYNLKPCDGLENNDDYWGCVLEYLGEPYLHSIGTCRMGTNKMNSVVDSRLKVHGINKLRIVDGSVIPSVTTSHLNAPIIALAERMADVIKRKYAYIHYIH